MEWSGLSAFEKSTVLLHAYPTVPGDALGMAQQTPCLFEWLERLVFNSFGEDVEEQHE